MQSAILRTYINNRGDYTERLVQISADHDWSGGPHQDTVPFSVGSNQYLYPAEDANPETLSALRDDQHQS